MEQLKNKSFMIRKVVGIAIIIHGLYRVATVTSYVDYVIESFAQTMGDHSLLIIGATLLPFLEFLAGALLFMKVGVKRSALLAGCISLLMAVFIIIGRLHFIRLVYHILILGGLTWVFYAYRPIILNEREFNFSKRKVKSWTHNFFRLW